MGGGTMQIKRITCIQIGGELPDFCHRLVMPDYGMPLIATILAEAGYDVKVYVEHIKPPEWDRIAESDLVCLSLFSAGADKVYRLCSDIRSRLGIPTIIGGTHASYYPESCLQYCDYVVFGEGDETIVELIDTLERDGDVGQVAGIAYRTGDGIHRTAVRPGPARFDTIPNFSLIEGYRRMDLFDFLVRRKKALLTAQSSRGCHFNCTFCIVNTMFPTGYRKRDIESVILDLRDKRRYGRELMFVDNDFAGHRAYTKRLLQKIIEEDFDFEIVVFARVEVAKDVELLTLMRRAGIRYIFQGYESIHPETLVAFNKRQTLEHIVAAIEKLHSFGFHIWGSFVVGTDTDTLETLQCTVDFVLAHRLTNAYFFPIWGHYPERSNGYRTLIPWHRSIFLGWRYCNGHFVTHFPLHMPPSRLQRAIADAHRTIYSPAQIVYSLKDRRFVDAQRKILVRYQWMKIEEGVREYIPFLEQLECGLYDRNGQLREDLLIERVRKDPAWTFGVGTRPIETLQVSLPKLCGTFAGT